MKKAPESKLKNIRLIITDLDNTALTPQKTFSKRTIRAFSAVMEHGIHTGVDTARAQCLSTDLFRMLGVDCAVSNDGATVYYKNELVYGAVIPDDVVYGLLSFCNGNKACKRLTAITENCLYTNLLISEYDYLRPNFLYHDFSKPLGEPVYKILAELTEPDLASEIAERFGCRLQNYRGESLYCYVMPQTGKFYSLCRLCDVLGISIDQVVAFGDDYGDIEMINGAGYGVAMDNAIDEVKEVADYICGPNTEDGVAEFIEKYIL